jgi:hypothetical protein
MERPLFNSRAYLTDGAGPEEEIASAAGETTANEPVLREDAVEEEPGAVSEPAGGGLFD